MALIKRSQLDRPLSCTEYDNNLDATLNRANHVGVQSASTIYDLYDNVKAYDYIVDLIQCCDDLTQELIDLRESIFGDGELADILNALRTELINLINQLTADIPSMKTDISTNATNITNLNTSLTTLATRLDGEIQDIIDGLALKANIHSPFFTGIPKAPTPGSTPDPNQIVTVNYLTSSLTLAMPVGMVVPYAGTSPPPNWLFANGAVVSASTYPALAAVMGVSGSFSLPNLATRVPVGAGGGYNLNATGGAATHVLSASQMPYHNHSNSHSHSINDPGHFHSYIDKGEYGNNRVIDYGRDYNYADRTWNTNSSTTGISINPSYDATGAAGGNAPHNNMQPFIVLNYIIKVL